MDKSNKRPAGSGFIYPESKPVRRGVWDLYDTSSNNIGLFEVSFWLELDDSVDRIEASKALDELATFIRDNVNENIVVIEFGSRMIMGGYGSGQKAGIYYLNNKDLDEANEWFTYGYEIRLMRADAVTFMTLWQGHEGQS